MRSTTASCCPPAGRVESIGLRSTRIRRPDRALITIPNAELAQLHIVNLSACDQMPLTPRLGPRYETTPDRMRFLLAELRALLHAHPLIGHTADEPIRVSLAGLGEHALHMDCRAYPKTTSFNAFLALREDILLRITEIVQQSGTGFVFASQGT
jgi:MscS family membrane protein